MNQLVSHPPLVINPEQLEHLQSSRNLVLIDLQKVGHYLHTHIPGAVNLDYAHLVTSEGPACGLLPSAEVFSGFARKLGISNDSYVVAYDTEGGIAASRLIWTLHVFGHWTVSLLNGGLHHWMAADRPLASVGKPDAEPGNFTAQSANRAMISGDELLSRLGDDKLAILDARSLEEYNGSKVFAARGGHIPGAKHLEWSDALDRLQHLRFKSRDTLQSMLDERGITRQHEVIVHCQTHRRSSLSYVMLKYLGYDNVRAYSGSWSEWGNRQDTPVACP